MKELPCHKHQETMITKNTKQRTKGKPKKKKFFSVNHLATQSANMSAFSISILFQAAQNKTKKLCLCKTYTVVMA